MSGSAVGRVQMSLSRSATPGLYAANTWRPCLGLPPERLADKDVPVTTDPGATSAEQEGSKYCQAKGYHISVTAEDMCGPKLLGLSEEQIQY